MGIHSFLIGLLGSFLVLAGEVATAGELAGKLPEVPVARKSVPPREKAAPAPKPGQSSEGGASSARGQAGLGILVETVYAGANAQVVSETVRAPIEQQINGLYKMRSMRSRCSSDGKYVLALTIERGMELKLEQVLVQNRVALALPQLPQEVQNASVNVKRGTSGVVMIVTLTSPKGDRDGIYLNNYANIQIKDALSRLPGVGEAALLDPFDYSLRIWLDPEKLAARNLAASEVVRALKEQNMQVAPGKIGQPPAPPDQVYSYTLSAIGRLLKTEEYADIILRADGAGRMVRLKDVARIEVGVDRRQRQTSFNGKPVAALVLRLTGAIPPRKVRAALQDVLSDLRARLPSGLDLAVAFDFTPNLEAADRPATAEYLLLDLHLPAGTSAARTVAVLKHGETGLRQVPGVQDVLALSENPFDLFGNDPCILVRLTPAEKRKAGREEVVRAIRAKLDEIRVMTARLRDLSGPSRFPRCGYAIDLALRGPELKQVREFARKLAERMGESKKLTDVWANRDSEPQPWRTLDIDGTAAMARGVSKEDIFNTLQVYLGSSCVCNFIHSGRTWRVQMQAGPGSGDGATDLLKLKVRNARGQMVALNALVKVRETAGPMVLDFLDGRPMVEITANPAPGVKLDAARKLCETLADEVRKELRLPADYRLVWLQEAPASR